MISKLLLCGPGVGKICPMLVLGNEIEELTEVTLILASQLIFF